MSAEIEVRNVFTIRGRGAVAIAYVRRGTVRVGQQTPALALGGTGDQTLTLAAVEALHAPGEGGDAIGVTFRERPSMEALQAALPPGTVLRLEEPGGTGDGTA